MLNCKITVSGAPTADHLRLAIEHIACLVGEGYTSGDDPIMGYSFEVDGEEEMEKRTFTYEEIAVGDLASTDLRAEYSTCSAGTQVLLIRILDADEKEHPERAEALYDPESMRMGIAWGADATWADVDGLESGIEMWLNDGETWSQRN